MAAYHRRAVSRFGVPDSMLGRGARGARAPFASHSAYSPCDHTQQIGRDRHDPPEFCGSDRSAPHHPAAKCAVSPARQPQHARARDRPTRLARLLLRRRRIESAGKGGAARGVRERQHCDRASRPHPVAPCQRTIDGPLPTRHKDLGWLGNPAAAPKSTGRTASASGPPAWPRGPEPAGPRRAQTIPLRCTRFAVKRACDGWTIWCCFDKDRLGPSPTAGRLAANPVNPARETPIARIRRP